MEGLCKFKEIRLNDWPISILTLPDATMLNRRKILPGVI